MTGMRVTRAAIGIFMLLAAVALTAPTANAAVFINIACGSPIGATIPASGSYVLGDAASNCGSLIAIEINASNVTLDLNHNVIDGTDQAASEGIAVVTGQANVRVENGTVRDFITGIDSGATNFVASNVVVRSNTTGISLAHPGTVTSSVVTGNSGRGIQALGGSSTFSHNVVVDNGQDGILGNSGDRILGNTIVHNAASGGDAIDEGTGNLISGNTIIGNQGPGILATNANTISSNRLTANGGGILIGSSNAVVGNSVRETNAVGIHTSVNQFSGNTFSKNSVRNNNGNGIDIGDNDVVSRNTVIGNLGEGISSTPTGSVFSGALTRNTIGGNLNNGVNIVDAVAPATAITKNVVDGNGQQGIRIPVGPPPNQQKANEAHGNGASTQCDQNLCTSKRVRHAFTIDCTQTTGKTITKPGRYTLSKAVRNCTTSTTLIQVSARHVTLDLGTMLLDGTSVTCQAGLNVTSPHVKILGGVEHDCTVGLNLEGSRGTVKGTSFSTGINGIQTNVSQPSKARISSVTVDHCTVNGIVATGASVTRSVMAFNATGAQGGTFRFTDNTVALSTFNGIFLTFGNKIVGNLIAGNNSAGIAILDRNTVSSNAVLGNGGRGIDGGTRNSISRDVVEGNGSNGIFGRDSNVLSRNVVIANGATGIAVGDMNAIARNTSSSNGGGGINANASDDSLNGTTISRNVTDGNNDNGISLPDPALTTVSVTKNRSDGNGGQGINVAAGTPPSGAHTNEASGDAGTPPCDANLC